MKIGIADYGLNVWDGGGCFDQQERWLKLRQIGYEGVERLTALSAEHALQSASDMRRMGMDFATVRAPGLEWSIRWTAAMGKEYVWTHVDGRSFEVFCRQVRVQGEACGRFGIRAALHNHMGTPVETQEQLERFLEECPDSQLVFDTAHLAAMGGDAVEIARKYASRIQVLHLKDWLATDPDHPDWTKRGRFCGLGLGNIGLDNVAVLNAAVNGGFDGWVFVEHDTHLQEPMTDLKISRQVLCDAGY
ncbi:MAG: Xylose isomerase domain protein barrel [Paenibacillaceae bacterium]|jgi:inosose dehydratase|nr:Xylose isomerase domain protein barrel [Paenibacillaceae bacterium]